MSLHTKIVKLNEIIRPYLELIAAVVIIVSLLISIGSLKVSKKALEISQKAYDSSETSTDKMIKNLEDLNKLSKDTKDKLSELPQNIAKLNNAVKNISENTKLQSESISKNLFVMEKTIKDFSNTISGYDKELKSITETADKQLALIKEQQRKLEEEARRAPDLAYFNNKISKGSDGKISIYPGVVNTGNKMATEVIVYVEFPADLIIETALPKGASTVHKDYVQFTFAPGTIHAMSGGSISAKNAATPIIIDTSKYLDKKIAIYYVIVDSINSYSGSLILDVESLKMEMGKREISKP